MKKIIFVNNTAAMSGGALTVLKQLLNQIKKREDKSKIYYFFVTASLKEYECEYIKIIDNINGKKMLDRIKWDRSGMRKWSYENNIKPDLIISLQNIAVKFKGIPQIVYLHQPLPYAKESIWSLMKADERKLWAYKHIYKRLIHNSFDDEMDIVVQTNWMKNALIEKGIKKDKITISKPEINDIDVEKINFIESKVENEIMYFYPAAAEKYKNHEIILKALLKLKEDDFDTFKKRKVIFTLTKESPYYVFCKEKDLLDNVKFIGAIPYNKVLEYYKSCDAVLFPSYVETFGLPLLEGAQFGKCILASDCEYAHEVLDGYNNVRFIKYDNKIEWAKNLSNSKYEDIGKFENKTLNSQTWDEFFILINKKLSIY